MCTALFSLAQNKNEKKALALSELTSFWPSIKTLYSYKNVARGLLLFSKKYKKIKEWLPGGLAGGGYPIFLDCIPPIFVT